MDFNLFRVLRRPDFRELQRRLMLFQRAGYTQKQATDVVEGLLATGLSKEEIIAAVFVPEYANMVITQQDVNDNTTNTTVVTAHPSGNDTLNPPASLPSGVTSGSGLFKVTGWVAEGEANGFTFANDSLISTNGGLIDFPTAWGAFRHSQNTATVAAYFAFDDGNQIVFSPRPIPALLPNIDDLGIVSGGGQKRMVAGEAVSVWIASDRAGTVVTANANVVVNKLAN